MNHLVDLQIYASRTPKDYPYKMTDAMGDLQIMIRVVNGKTAILINTTNTMARQLNSLIQDIRAIDTTLQNWQNTLHVLAKHGNVPRVRFSRSLENSLARR